MRTTASSIMCRRPRRPRTIPTARSRANRLSICTANISPIPSASICIQPIEFSGTVRPWGLGPRVPLYVISPWSRGGWVNSQVFDHTSVGQFLEKRFGITIPAISPWHRAVCGDLTSAFDFVNPNDGTFPRASARSATPPP